MPTINPPTIASNRTRVDLGESGSVGVIAWSMIRTVPIDPDLAMRNSCALFNNAV